MRIGGILLPAIACVASPRARDRPRRVDRPMGLRDGFGATGGPGTAVERYDPAADAWTEVAPIPQGVNHAGLAGERFDPATGRWEAMAPMPTSRHGLGAAVLGGSIWVVAGGPRAGLSTSAANERFTP